MNKEILKITTILCSLTLSSGTILAKTYTGVSGEHTATVENGTVTVTNNSSGEVVGTANINTTKNMSDGSTTSTATNAETGNSITVNKNKDGATTSVEVNGDNGSVTSNGTSVTAKNKNGESIGTANVSKWSDNGDNIYVEGSNGGTVHVRNVDNSG